MYSIPAYCSLYKFRYNFGDIFGDNNFVIYTYTIVRLFTLSVYFYYFLVITHIYISGTGKTLLANAVATEANVPIFSFKGSELDEVEKIRDLFEVFHDTNDDTGSCVIFIDNIETLGCKF